MFDISNTCLKKGCLEGEVAVITGSTSNVGKGFAQAIAWAGGKVVIVGRGAERGKAVADEINADNGKRKEDAFFPESIKLSLFLFSHDFFCKRFKKKYQQEAFS